jgi:hypothetical protein
VEDPTDSLDLAPCNFLLFGRVKEQEQLKGRIFAEEEEL